eukprot:scaffold204665_cov33-Tisochrysis_lutea.AAC.1
MRGLGTVPGQEGKGETGGEELFIPNHHSYLIPCAAPDFSTSCNVIGQKPHQKPLERGPVLVGLIAPLTWRSAKSTGRVPAFPWMGWNGRMTGHGVLLGKWEVRAKAHSLVLLPSQHCAREPKAETHPC